MTEGATVNPLPKVPGPAPVTLSQTEQDELMAIAHRAGITKLNARNTAHYLSAAAIMREMIGRMQRPAGFADEPANIFHLLAS
jgi:aspartyl-tRNA(Asn)/glutamyl-tRNA(Gln) amidotransferase subunit A